MDLDTYNFLHSKKASLEGQLKKLEYRIKTDQQSLALAFCDNAIELFQIDAELIWVKVALNLVMKNYTLSEVVNNLEHKIVNLARLGTFVNFDPVKDLWRRERLTVGAEFIKTLTERADNG